MVEREKQDKTNGSEVNRTIEQREIAAPRVTHACALRFFFLDKRSRVVWRGASMPHFRETPVYHKLTAPVQLTKCPHVSASVF